MKFKTLHLLFFIILFAFSAFSEELELQSPGKISKFKINIGETINYSVFFKGNTILLNSSFSLEFAQGAAFEKDFVVEKKTQKEIDETWKPLFGKHAVIRNHCNELKLTVREIKFPGRILELTYRAYDDGVAFRYTIPLPSTRPTLNLKHEKTQFAFQNNHTVWMADHNVFDSPQESEFRKAKLSDIYESNIIGLPLLVQVGNYGYAAITEADLTGWGALYLKGSRDGVNTLTSTLATIPGSDAEEGHKLLAARLNLPADSPWRVILLSDKPAKLLESEILMNLNEPCRLENTSWIQPGKCAWDAWWTGTEELKDNASNKRFIDFASSMGFPYQLVDAGWSDSAKGITVPAKHIQMPELVQYAKDKNVKLWLWAHWTDIDKDYEKAFPLYEKWGIAGVKVDFMNRDDQQMVEWYHKIFKKAADHHLMVNFHGAYKPTGIRRTYPNAIAREGVMGNEYNKWSDRMTPEHNVTIAFTRNLLGEMDFTPGGFLNRAKGQLRANVTPTQVIGTRCHQLAMFVVYDSPLTTVCDDPVNYYNQPGLEFLKIVPTVWDDIKAVNGEVAQYITVAKKSGTDWFIGSMNNSDPRELTVKLDFLDSGNYKARIFQDTPESEVNAEKLEEVTMTVAKGGTLKIKMASGGGFAARLIKIN